MRMVSLYPLSFDVEQYICICQQQRCSERGRLIALTNFQLPDRDVAQSLTQKSPGTFVPTVFTVPHHMPFFRSTKMDLWGKSVILPVESATQSAHDMDTMHSGSLI